MKFLFGNPAVTNPQGRFGLIEGVFNPCVLTILGVIMFMRTGFVLGHSGLWLALIILGISKLITTLTTLSLSAISTNTEVRGGGVYFMISRALGPDFGGTIGITLFIAQAVGVSFYVIGFTEALLGAGVPLLHMMGAENVSIEQLAGYHVPELISSVMVVILFALTFKGADVALRVQNYVLVILIVSIASFLIGGIMQFDPVVFQSAKAPEFTDGIGFWTAFAIFFPAATGISAGANMSGDLKNPERSIPWGTLLAILVTFLIYVAQLILVSGSSTREMLKVAPFESLQAMSLFAPLIVLGVFAATLSSALGSFLGAPRILQAMGRDRLISALSYFAVGKGESDEPQRATVLTFAIAIMVIWAGDLNAVAEVISMFFLIAYGTINLSAFVESRGGNPSFRPTFKYFHWITALAGAIGCTIAMMKINDTYALLALSISALIYFYLNKKDINTSFGDAKRGYIFKGVRDGLHMLEGTTVHPKNWRPVLLAVTESPTKDVPLIRAGSWLENGRGLYSVVCIREGNSTNLQERLHERDQQIEHLQEIKKNEKIKAFSESLVTDDFHQGLSAFLQSHSVGALRANSVMLSIPPQFDEEAKEHFFKTLDVVASFHLNLILLKSSEMSPNKKKRTIDLWWRGETNGSLMALFSYLLTLNPAWQGSRIRLLRSVSESEGHQKSVEKMEELKRLARIEAEVKVLPSLKNAYDVIKAVSAQEADIVFLGMGATDGAEAKASLEKILPLIEDLPTTMLVWSNGEANIFV